ncbi:MAG TPA: hypothetical protein VGN63_04720 [Flavisolibacter sp.]|nr:hypothetical protein [Flavisolibacter sp.]
MMNLKRFFQPASCRLTVSKSEKEILELFLLNKKEFEQWILLHPQSRIRFQFYFPTAVDFYFDGFRLFTAYFKRGTMDSLQLSELKMSQDNHSSIRTANWKPFEDVMVSFLTSLAESNKSALLQKTKALHEYASICKDKPVESKYQDMYAQQIKTNMAAG